MSADSPFNPSDPTSESDRSTSKPNVVRTRPVAERTLRIPRVHHDFLNDEPDTPPIGDDPDAHEMHQRQLLECMEETIAANAPTPDYQLTSVSQLSKHSALPSTSNLVGTNPYKTDEVIDRIAQSQDDVLVSFVEEAFSLEDVSKDSTLGTVETAQEHNPFTDRLLKTYSIVVANSSSNIRTRSTHDCVHSCERECKQMQETGHLCAVAQARLEALSESLQGALKTSTHAATSATPSPPTTREAQHSFEGPSLHNLPANQPYDCEHSCAHTCQEFAEFGKMCPIAQARLNGLAQKLQGALATSHASFSLPKPSPKPTPSSTSSSSHHAIKLAHASLQDAFSVLWSIDGVLGVCLLDLDAQSTVYRSEAWSDALTVEVEVIFPMMRAIFKQVQSPSDAASLEDIILTTTHHIQIVRMIPSFSRRCVVAFLHREKATPALARWAVQEACTRLAEMHG